jgi:hypothetical protein
MSAAVEPITAAVPEQLTQKALTWPEQARGIAITDQATFDRAQEMLLGIRDLRKEVENTFGPICKKAHDAWKEATGQRKRADDPLEQAEQLLRPKITGYIQQQERIRLEAERRAREEAARQAREAEEARQAEIRRQEAEAKRLAEERALADAVQAEAEGAEPEEVSAILDTPVDVQHFIAPPPPPVQYVAPVVPQTYQRAEGVSKPRDNWSAEVTDLHALVKHVAEHPECLNYLAANTVALNQMAKAQKQLMKIPGVRAVNNPNVSVRSRY